MRCDECRHWMKDADRYNRVPGIGQCVKAIQLWDATEWTKDADGDDDYCQRVVKPKYDGQMSFVSDSSDYHARLWTMPQFFCAHFDKKMTNVGV